MTLDSRIGDATIGTCCACDYCTCGGIIVTGAAKTIVEGSPTSRIGDIVISFCGGTGVIVSGASKTIVEGSPSARIGDQFVGCYTGTIIGSASKTHME